MAGLFVVNPITQITNLGCCEISKMNFEANGAFDQQKKTDGGVL